MECKRATGAGVEAPNIVAGMRAVFRSRSFSGKIRSRANKEESHTSPSVNTQQLPPNNSNKNNNNKSHRPPKSPFLGWRKCKLKESLESKENTKLQDPHVADRVSTCSQSQVERISSHSSDDYAPTLGVIRNIIPGQSASFETQADVHKTVSNPTDTCSNNSSQSLGVQSNINVMETNIEERKGELISSCELNNSSHGCEKMENCANNSYIISEDKNITGSVDKNTHNNNPRSGSSSSENIVSSINCCESLPESCNLTGCNEQSNGVVEESPGLVRDRGDGSDTQEVCGEGKLGNESCIKYFRDIYINSKTNDDCIRPRGVPVGLSRGLWLKYALSYNLHIPESPRNEVSVLSLGIDQYIEEVFRYLDHSGIGRVSIENFDALCLVLGLPEDGKKGQQRCRCLGSNSTLNGSLNLSSVNIDKFKDSECPLHLKFNEFHNKLFTKLTHAAKVKSIVPLDCRRPNNPRLVTSVVNVQRRYDLLENISQSMSQMDAKLDSEETRVMDQCDTTGIVCCKCRQMAHVDRNSNISPKPLDAETSYLQRQILLQEQELQCLREVIEDMRIALQSSDAENLALQVKIKRSEDISPRMSQADLSLTDEEDTIDNLVRQLNELDCPALLTVGADTSVSSHPAHNLVERLPQGDTTLNQESVKPESLEDPLNTAFVSGDFSLEAELQATYEALQTSREEQEAMQVDLQHTVGQLQERESELERIELRLREAHSALEKAHHDNHVLVMEIAETRHSLEESRSKLTEACEELRQTKDNSLMKDKQLHEAQARLILLNKIRESVVQGVTAARSLVAGSLHQVRAGEHALAARPHAHPHAHDLHTSIDHSLSPPTSTNKLDMTGRADSGLYSEESERDDDMHTPDRSSDPISASEDDLWTPRRTSRGDDSSCSSSFRSSSTSPDSDDDPSRDTRSHLMIKEEGDLSQYKRSPMPKEDPRWSDRTQLMIIEGDRSKWKTSFTGPGISSTAIIEGLEREVEWVQRKLEEAERECDEVESNAYEMEEDARWRLSEGGLMHNMKKVRTETRTKLTRSQLDKLQQLRQVLMPLPNSLSHERLA